MSSKKRRTQEELDTDRFSYNYQHIRTDTNTVFYQGIGEEYKGKEGVMKSEVKGCTGGTQGPPPTNQSKDPDATPLHTQIDVTKVIASNPRMIREDFPTTPPKHIQKFMKSYLKS